VAVKAWRVAAICDRRKFPVLTEPDLFFQYSPIFFNSFCESDFVMLAAREPNQPTISPDVAKAFSPGAAAVVFHLFDRLRAHGRLSTPIYLLSFRLHFSTGGSNGPVCKTGALDKFSRSFHRFRTSLPETTGEWNGFDCIWKWQHGYRLIRLRRRHPRRCGVRRFHFGISGL